MDNIAVNYLAVLVAGVAYSMLGGLWYSPILFAKPWMAAMGLTEADTEQLQKGAPAAYATSFIASLVAAFVLALAIGVTGVTTVQGGLTTGFFIWFGFVATTNAPPYFYEDRPKKVYLIYAGYTLASFLVMSVILTIWR